MDLIIGGAYMGKRTFAMGRYGFSEEDISDAAVDGLEETGRLLQYLAGEAEHVYRVFCGLGVALK